MPLVWFSSFLLHESNKHWTRILPVSMPSVVLSSFLHKQKFIETKWIIGVNALSRAFFISTCHRATKNKCERECVNALSRAFFISTSGGCGWSRDKRGVSMPSVVLSSFLLEIFDKEKKIGYACQCPQSCFLHFYVTNGSLLNEHLLMVSMPSVVLSSFLLNLDMWLYISME